MITTLFLLNPVIFAVTSRFKFNWLLDGLSVFFHFCSCYVLSQKYGSLIFMSASSQNLWSYLLKSSKEHSSSILKSIVFNDNSLLTCKFYRSNKILVIQDSSTVISAIEYVSLVIRNAGRRDWNCFFNEMEGRLFILII